MCLHLYYLVLIPATLLLFCNTSLSISQKTESSTSSSRMVEEFCVDEKSFSGKESNNGLCGVLDNKQDEETLVSLPPSLLSSGEIALVDDVGDYDHNENGNKQEPQSIMDFTKALKSFGTSFRHMFVTYIHAFQNAEGKYYSRLDVLTDDIDEGLNELRKLVARYEMAASSSDDGGGSVSNNRKWQFLHNTYVPYYKQSFNRTLDDVYRSFLIWSAIDGTQDDECGIRGGVNNQKAFNTMKINVSKAYRRLTAYVTWMEHIFVSSEYGDDDLFVINPIQDDNIMDIFQMEVSYDGVDRLVWWFDLDKTIQQQQKKKQLGQPMLLLSGKDIIRLFVWLMHKFMFDEMAQRNGMVIVDNVGKIHTTFWNFMTLLPTNIGLSIHEFVISILPIKKKRVIFMNTPLWFDIAYHILSIGLPTKMKRLTEIIHDNYTIIEDRVGIDYIPKGFAGEWVGVMDGEEL